MRALSPLGGGAESASWTASASGFGGGLGPAIRPLASAVAVTPTARIAVHRSSRRERGRRRRTFMRAFLLDLFLPTKASAIDQDSLKRPTSCIALLYLLPPWSSDSSC